MKLKTAVLAVSLLAFGAGMAHAGSWSLGLNGGAAKPTGDFGDAAATGWNVGVGMNNMVNSTWGIGADLGYHSWGGSDDYNSALQVLSGDPSAKGSFSAIQATGAVSYHFPTNGNVHPYLKGGLGLYNVKASLESSAGNADDSWSKLGYNFGAGMNFATQGNMQWGFNGAYHMVQTKDDLGANTNMFTVGMNVNFGMGN
jgi:opacity protein-like surface antigen